MTHSDIATLLDSEDPMVRKRVLFCDSLSPDHIERLLTDPDATVREMAADMLDDVSAEMISRVLDEYPEEIGHFALRHTAPGIVLGHRALNWVGEPDLNRYLDYRNATNTQRGRMYAMYQTTGDRMTTLVELWDAAFGSA
jgi:hypothetical protein